MGRPSSFVVMLPAATRTTSVTASEIVSVEDYTAARIVFGVTTVGGTTPTLDVYIQNAHRAHGSVTNVGDKAAGALTWNDFAHFTQATTSNTTFHIGVVAGGNFAAAAQDGALAAATVRNGPLGSYWRVKAVLGGTSPSFQGVNVVAELIP